MTGMIKIEKDKFTNIKSNQKLKRYYIEGLAQALLYRFVHFQVNLNLKVLIIYF